MKSIFTFFLIFISFAGNTQTVVNIPPTTGTADAGLPLDRMYQYGATETIYLGSAIGTTGNITKIGWYIGVTRSDATATIYMKSIAGSTASNPASTTGYTTVYSGTIPGTVAGYQSIVLSTPFNFSSTSNNLSVIVEYSTTAADGASVIYSRTASVGNTRTSYYRSNTTAWVSGSTTMTLTDTYIPDVQITIDPPVITGTTPATRCGTGTVTLGATANTGAINWYSALTGGPSLGAGTNFTTPSISSTTTYYCDATLGGTTSSPRTAVAATVINTPVAPGTISGTSSVCSTVNGIAYSVAAVADADTYNWAYTGTGLTCATNCTTNSITADFSSATSGDITISATNACGTSGSSPAFSVVTSSPVGGTTAGATTIYRTQTVVLTLSGQTGTIQWQDSPDNATWSDVTDGSGATTTSYTTAGLTSTTYFRARLSVSGCADAFSSVSTVTVDPAFVWLGAADSLWVVGDNSRWSPSEPTSSDDVVILSNTVLVTRDIDVSCRNLTIQLNAFVYTWNSAFSNKAINVSGDLVVNGTLSSFYSPTSSNLTKSFTPKLLKTGGTITIGATGDISDGEIHLELNSAIYSLNSNMKIHGMFIEYGELDMNGFNVTTWQLASSSTRSGKITLGTGILTIAGTSNATEFYDNGTVVFIPSATGTVVYDATGTHWSGSFASQTLACGATCPYTGNQTVQNLGYSNLQINVINGNTTTLGNDANFSISEDLVLLNPSTAGGIVTTAADINLTKNLYIAHNGTSNSGNGLTLNVGHRLYRGTGTGTLYMGTQTDNVINITYLDANGIGDEAFTGFGTPTFYGSVDYGGAGSQEIIGANFYTLNINKDFSAAGTKELLGNVSVSKQLKIWFATLSATDGTTARNITLQGDFTNLGVFIPSTGKVICSGTAAQIIQGSQTTFYDFEINKPVSGSVTEICTNGLILSNNIDFTAGDLTPNLSGSPVIFGTSSNITTPASNSSHINGYVAKMHNTIAEFTYPCGDGTKYRPCSTTPSSTTAQTFLVKYNSTAFGDLTIKTETNGIDHLSGDEHWEITSTAGTPNAKVKLTWDANSSIDGVETKSDLVVAHYDGADWERGSTGTPTLVDNGATGSLQSDFTTQFSPFKFASIGFFLPIELLDFSAKLIGEKVVLQWQTATEINNDFFTIEKSLDAINWLPIDEVLGAGNSSEILSYKTTDNNIYQGIFYYRLKQTDFDGTFSYSPIETIQVNDKNLNTVSAYYTASQNKLIIQFGENDSTPSEIYITDGMGKILLSKSIVLSANSNYIQQLPNLAKGVYLLNIKNKTSIYSLKFVIN